MNANLAIGDERTLRRIVALLFALAVLAERVAVRSWPVRFLVLCLLRRAETVAGAFVFEATGMPPEAIEGFAAVGNGPADALRLAARFHALAMALGALLPDAGRLNRWPARRGFAFGNFVPGSGRSLEHFAGKWNHLPSHKCGKNKRIERQRERTRVHAPLDGWRPKLIDTS